MKKVKFAPDINLVELYYIFIIDYNPTIKTKLIKYKYKKNLLNKISDKLKFFILCYNKFLIY